MLRAKILKSLPRCPVVRSFTLRQTYSTANRIFQEDTVSCPQLETQAQPLPYTQMHSLALLNQETLISTFTTVLCPPL